MKDWTISILISSVIIIIILLSTIGSQDISSNICINYIIKHPNYIKIDKIDGSSNIQYSLPFSPNMYYDDMTIKKSGDSNYYIVCWGNRTSWVWNFLGDKTISNDIPYKRSKNENCIKDIRIIEILDSIYQNQIKKGNFNDHKAND